MIPNALTNRMSFQQPNGPPNAFTSNSGYGPQYDVSRFNGTGLLGAPNPMTSSFNPNQGVGAAAPGSWQSKFKSALPGIGDLFSRVFGSNPYDDASKEYNQDMSKAYGYLDPYNQAGQRGLSQYDMMLGKMSNPQDFVNNILSGYSMSPAAQLELNQGEHGISAAAAASGMLGSSSFGGNMADYAERLTSKDMQQYLQNILGVNRDALSGYSDISHMGESAASQESQEAAHQAEENAGMKYGSDQYSNGMWGDIGSIVSDFI